MKNKSGSRSSAAISLVIIGIIAVALLLVISIMKKYSMILLGAQGVVLLCLFALLGVQISARSREKEREMLNSRSPYGTVDKKEIDKIFDMIDKEEKRRGRVMAFNAGLPVSAAETRTQSQTSDAEDKKTELPEVQSLPTDTPEEEDEDKLPIIFPDQDEYEGEKKAFSPISEERAAARREEKEREKEKEAASSDESSESKDEIADLVAAASLGAVAGEMTTPDITADSTAQGAEPEKTRKSGKGGKNMDNRPKKRQPVYYDQYGRPIAAPPVRQAAPAQPVGYDQYGRPIYQRPPQRKPRPIGFDQNGRPIYPPQQRKPRVPVGYDQYGRPIFAPAPPAQGGRPRPAGARPPQGQRRRPPQEAAVPGTEQTVVQTPQIPTEPMAASAADALAALEATAAAGGTQYYDEDYIPVVVHTEEDFNYNDDRYTPRVRAGIMDDAPASVAPASIPSVPAAAAPMNSSYNPDEFNSSGTDTYRPDYASEDIPVVVPVFEDMEVDYSTSRGFTPMGNTYAPPVYNPEPTRVETPLAPTPIYQDPTASNPEYNAKSAADYTRDADEDHFVYVPHFDDDDPIPEPEPEVPSVPHWKLAKMRRRKVTRRSRRGMLFKLKSDKFSDYTQALKA